MLGIIEGCCPCLHPLDIPWHEWEEYKVMAFEVAPIGRGEYLVYGQKVCSVCGLVGGEEVLVISESKLSKVV